MTDSLPSQASVVGESFLSKGLGGGGPAGGFQILAMRSIALPSPCCWRVFSLFPGCYGDPFALVADGGDCEAGSFDCGDDFVFLEVDDA